MILKKKKHAMNVYFKLHINAEQIMKLNVMENFQFQNFFFKMKPVLNKNQCLVLNSTLQPTLAVCFSSKNTSTSRGCSEGGMRTTCDTLTTRALELV